MSASFFLVIFLTSWTETLGERWLCKKKLMNLIRNEHVIEWMKSSVCPKQNSLVLNSTISFWHIFLLPFHLTMSECSRVSNKYTSRTHIRLQYNLPENKLKYALVSDRSLINATGIFFSCYIFPIHNLSVIFSFHLRVRYVILLTTSPLFLALIYNSSLRKLTTTDAWLLSMEIQLRVSSNFLIILAIPWSAQVQHIHILIIYLILPFTFFSVTSALFIMRPKLNLFKVQIFLAPRKGYVTVFKFLSILLKES